MAIMGLKDFECSVCQQTFTMLSADFIPPGPYICTECLEELWELEGDKLRDRIAQRLAGETKPGESSSEQQEQVEQTVQLVLGFKQGGKTLQQIRTDRETGWWA